MLSVLQQLAGEEMVLFKEKINYKFAGSGRYRPCHSIGNVYPHGDIGGFDPHIDANAYTHVKNIKHLTVLAAVDEMTAENGGLEVVDGSHRMAIPLGDDRCIDRAWVDGQAWTPCDLETGIFLHISFPLRYLVYHR